jgi:4-alpha-glucanotransferase
MKYPGFKNPVTGVAVPVSSLRSRSSLGIGEFADLPALGQWAVSAGISLIQILPVNDTGYERSPYSALSAFALHPVYACLSDFPEAVSGRSALEIAGEIAALKSELPHKGPVAFDAVLTGKHKILRSMWKSAEKADLKEAEKWEKANPWVRPYALFSLIRQENLLKAWYDWDKHQSPDEKEIASLWKERRKEAEFWVWLQWRLESQFRRAAEELDAMNIVLKGDIPILINDDSADVWADRENFHLNLRAGAPPDALASGGQNWGFPIYNWNHLRSADFHWWRRRLDQAAKFYHAFRIDHVLGFFRIWAVPEGDISALNGYFEPSVPVTRGDLAALGWDEGRITWCSLAHIPGFELRDNFGAEAPVVQGMLEQVGMEDLWRERPDGPSDKEVMASSLSEGAKERLMSLLRNRMLIPLDKHQWLPSINFMETRSWHSLSDGERTALSSLLHRKREESEALWETTGRELLSMMKRDGGMLVCAEDLGSVPDCVPGVLGDLGILGLKVVRWARLWDEEGQPYIPFDDYPALSVATGSVHDSTTLRGWLAGEARNDGELRKVLGLTENAILAGADGVRKVLRALGGSNSLVVVHPIQDLLALDPRMADADPESERINVPGVVSPDNWTWRMMPDLESLLNNDRLNSELKALCTRERGVR